MKWKFWERDQLETREDSLTDELVRRIVERAGGSVAASPAQSGALQIGAGLVGRAFASATVEGVTPVVRRALTPSVLETIGRSLLREGEALFYIRVNREGLRLFSVVSYDVTGSYDPNTWRYRLDLSGPSGTWSVNARPDSVVHCKHLVESQRPWRGVSPLDIATNAGALDVLVNQALSQESSGPVGSVIAIPKDGGSSTLDGLREQIRGLRGRTAIVETTAGGWGQGQAQAPRSDWKPSRLGANMPASMVELRADADRLVLAALGVPVGLVGGADGAAMRESWRQLLHATLAPLGRIVQEELREKLDAPRLTFDWSEIGASDIAGRARAFGSMVSAGMALDRAAALSGLLSQEEG